MTETEWWNSSDLHSLLLFVSDKSSERKLRLFAAGCCRQVPGLVSLELARRALEVGERFADGLADREELTTAWQTVRRRDEPALRTVAVALGGHSRRGGPGCSRIDWSHPLGRDLARNVISSSMEPASHAAGNAARDVAGGPAAGMKAIRARNAAIAFARKEHELVCCELLRCIFNPFHPLTSLDGMWLAWNDGCLVKMATAIYEERDFSRVRMGVLADALEESGCTSEEVLRHCHGAGSVHTRGCFVVDWLTGRA
jgi:hypothetical protein